VNPEVSPRTRRRLAILLFGVAGLILAFWLAWYGHRSLVAADHTEAYVAFENAFPVADGWLALLLILSGLGLLRRWPSTSTWLFLAAGAGVYLFCMDVLYDLEQGIWTKGANGLTELAINILTISLSILVGGFAWRNREALASNSDSTR
jgi:hypothetical protein